MKLMKHLSLCAFVLTATSAFAQFPLSFGVKAGVPITDAFSRTVISTTHLGNGTAIPLYGYSDSRNFIVGPTIELRLPLHLSVEADALYRPLNATREFVISNTGSTVISGMKSTNYPSWEFPIVAKAHVGFPIIKPYLEAGPSFRTTASAIGYLSGKGVTVGVGADVKALFLRVSPEFRYTHWGTDSKSDPNQLTIVSRKGQVEFLVGFSF
jgi:hypothetical protein